MILRRFLGAVTIALLFSAQLAAQPASGSASSVPAGSGLGAWELDDNAGFPAFLDFLSKRGRSSHEELAVGGRTIVRVVDAKGRPVPFATWRLAEGTFELAHGRAFADGSFLFYPSTSATSSSPRDYRIELAARGVSVTVPLSTAGASELRAVLPGARPLEAPLPCDLVFVVDATISMKKYLDALKVAIDSICRAVEATEPPLDPRFGLVLYRDKGDEYLAKATALDGDRSALTRELTKAVALGGGDIPEDLGAGLRAAVGGMAWSAGGIRLVFAFTDAIPSIRPGTPAAGGAHYADACAEALAAGIKVFTIGMGHVAWDGDYALRQIAQYTGAAFLSANLAAEPGEPEGPPGGGGFVRGSLETLIPRIVAGEARAASAGIFDGRDPALILLESVQARMATRLTYPEAARARRISGTARVELRVGPGGDLVDAHLSSSSGSAILDRASLDLARSAFPMENPAEAEVELSIAINFKLE